MLFAVFDNEVGVLAHGTRNIRCRASVTFRACRAICCSRHARKPFHIMWGTGWASQSVQGVATPRLRPYLSVSGWQKGTA